jgi:outer membrane protein OmpA-like peptidoglycan-associated protein
MKSGIKLTSFIVIATLLWTSCCTPKNKGAYMKKSFKSIKRSLKPNANVKMLNDSVIVTLPSSILFDFNSAALNADVLPRIAKFSKTLNKYDRTKILITGYTDSIGADEYNNKLSLQRADTAKGALIRNDVEQSRIETWGLGKRHPIATNSTEEGRAENRRVEFTIMYKQ